MHQVGLYSVGSDFTGVFAVAVVALTFAAAGSAHFDSDFAEVRFRRDAGYADSVGSAVASLPGRATSAASVAVPALEPAGCALR